MKERITISIDKSLLDFLDKGIEQRKFANRSHAIEYLIHNVKENNN